MAKDHHKLKNIKHYCYLISNKINSKVYIGTTYKDINIRFKEHLKISRFKSNDKKEVIHLAIAKYGCENFTVSLLSEFDTYQLAYQAEKDYIQFYQSQKNGYNRSPGGDAGPIIIKHSTDIIIKVLEDFCKGISLTEISVKHDLKRHSVFDITRLRISPSHKIPKTLLKKLELLKLKSKKKKRVTPVQIVKIIQEYVNGKSMQNIATQYQLSLNNIWNILHRNTWANISIEDNLIKQLNITLGISE